MRKRSRRRRILYVVLGAALALVVLIWIVLPLVVAPILRGKLEALVTNHLHAELKLANLSYRFPYTVHVTDARLVARGGANDGHELLRLARGTLALDELPLGRGPLLIHAIELDHPTLHLVRAPTGDLLGGGLLVRDPGSQPEQPDERMKLSDLFRLRRLTLRGGKVVYEDRARPGSPPMVWDNLTTDLGIAPRERAVYDFRYTAGGAPLAELMAKGSIDIDQLLLTVDAIVLTGRADASATQTSVPAVVQEFVRRHRIAGAVQIEGAGTVPLRDPASASAKASVEIEGGRAHVWRYDRTLDRLDLRLELEKPAGRAEITLRVPKVAARASPAEVTIADARGTLDWNAQTWRLSVPRAEARFFDDVNGKASTHPASAGSVALALDVAGSLDRGRIQWEQSSGRATLHDVTLRPPRFPHPLTHVSGAFQVTEGTMLAEQLSGRYGDDVWAVSSARVALTKLPDRVDVIDIVGAATFAPPSPEYPNGLAKVIAGLGPAGTFNVTGGFTRDRAAAGPKVRWDVLVTSDGGGAFAVTDRRIPLTSIRGAARVTREQIDVRRFLANSFDGAVAAAGTIDPRRPVSYRGEVSVENVDFHGLVERLRAPQNTASATATAPTFAVTGRLDGSLSLESEGGSVEMLDASGEIVVRDGVLWEVPVVSHVVGRTNVAPDALRAGEAGAVFEVRDGVVHVRHAAVSSPALGLQGWGTIDLRGGDRALDLDVVAAPLGDWERHLKKTRVPLVSDVAGAALGAMQKVLNTATSTLLYEFRVTGTPSKPHLAAVPAPVLTEAAAVVFHGMLKREKDVMKYLRQRDARGEGEPRTK